MLHHEPQAWIVYWLGGRELARITAAEATLTEPGETQALLAFENRCPLEDISVQIEEA
jgi:hypothetical protein